MVLSESSLYLQQICCIVWLSLHYLPHLRYMLNAAYLRLKNVTLGYTVPSSLLKKVGIARLRVFVQGENLLTLTPMKVKFADPETLGNMTYPINKKISVGMNLTL